MIKKVRAKMLRYCKNCEREIPNGHICYELRSTTSACHVVCKECVYKETKREV